MKQRFSSVDVKVIAHELSAALTTLRISNIYDLSSRIFLFKCAKPGSKAQLLVDSGFRCHLTSFTRTANPAPSAFVSRLRKYLKSRRITGVSQLGTDRVIEITFSDGQYRLFLEFFAAGNIVLTDSELTVLALLRQVSEGNEEVDVRLGGKYVVDAKQNFHGIEALSEERVRRVLEKQIQRVKAAQEAGGKKAKRAKGGEDLKKALSNGFSEYPVHLLDHVFNEVGFDASKKPENVLESAETLQSLMKALEKASDLFRSFEAGRENKGYIIAKEKEQKATSDVKQQHQPSSDAPSDEPTATNPRDNLLYEDFHPFRPSQFDGKPGVHVIEIDNFNKAVDEFYSSIESQKLESRLTEREEAAKKKLDTAKNEHEKRLGALQQVQEMHVRKAQTIEANTHRVEEAIAAINGLIGQGMDWVDIEKLIENEQKRNNVVAQLIKLPLKLHENTATMLLEEPGVEEEDSDSDEDRTDSESDSEDETHASTTKTSAAQSADKRLAIDIDLAITPWANARQYYDQKKSAAVKEQKTVQASTKALQSMERKTEADLKKGLKQEKPTMRVVRKQFWFEKFHYFISSDGYLVLGGKDAQQNEFLYRRYLKKGDIYVHADLQGASSVIVKNNPTTPDAPIPPSTLSQAGALTVCTSSAWDSKAVMAAWWVNSDQVSKTAPTGEYIKTGGFVIRGKKNFLPPTQLVLGFGVMWQISEESRVNHGKHRLQRTESMVSGEAEMLAADAQSLTLDDSADTRLNPHKAVVVDVEDVAADAENEIAENREAANEDEADSTHDEMQDDTDEEEHASAAPSEAGDSFRSNPLQANSSKRESRADDEALDEDDETSEDGEQEVKVHESEDGNDNSESEETTANDAQQATLLDPSPAQAQKPKSSRAKRGANTKAKRALKEKYALQTEEERELAMSLLGSSKGEQKRQDVEAARAAREAKAAADKERRKAQHQRAAEAERRRQEALMRDSGGDGVVDSSATGALMEEEKLDPEQVEQERLELLNIDLLVPHAEPGDELLAAIPVVAPWQSLSRHKYKVKLQPGSLKKGKVVKEILNQWNSISTSKMAPKIIDPSNRDKDKVWSRELDLVREWKLEEIVGVIPVKGCRVVQSGGTAAASAASAGGGGGKGGRGKGKGNPGRSGKGGKKR